MLKAKYILTVLGVFFSASLAWGGGEIGNAYKAYSNFLGEYSISYPSNWNYYDFNKSVSFVEESNVSPENTATLSVVDRSFPNITTKQELLEQIKFFHPNEKWRPITISNHDGYQTDMDKEGIIYLLKKSENVLSIRFNSAAKQDALLKIQYMVNSLQIK